MAINSLSASSNGLSGLVSGMNTQETVEKLLSGTQFKIDKVGQKKTALQYKQSMYRDVMTKLKTLQSSFLSFTSSTNLMSDSFFNTMNTTIKPPGTKSAAFSVTASSAAKPGNVTMNYIKELATAHTEKTTEDASAQVTGALDVEAAKALLNEYSGTDAIMSITVGGRSVSLFNAPKLLGGATQSDVAAEINKLFTENSIAAEARFVDNKLQIIAANEDEYITISGNKNINSTNPTLAMKMFGNGITNLSGKGTLSAKIDTDNYLPSFVMNLDGRQENITVSLKDLQSFVDGDSSKLVSNIQNQLTHTFGTGVKLTATGGSLLFSPGVSSQKFTITGNTKVMGLMGLETGISNKLNTNMALKDLNFRVGLEGDQHTFSVNGIEFSYGSSTSLTTIMNDINNSKAGVKISYSESEDRFVVQSAETGAGSVGFNVSQTQGNLMTVLFGEQGAFTSRGQGINIDMVAGNAAELADIKNGGVFSFNVNGIDYKFTVNRTKNDAEFTAETFAKKMNEAFRDTFGSKLDGTQKAEFKLEDGKFVIRSNQKDMVIKTTPYHKDKNTSLLGFAEKQSTLATSKNTTLGQAGIKFGAGASLNFTITRFDGNPLSSPVDVPFSLDLSTFSDSTTMDELVTAINDKIKTELGNPTDYPKVEYDEMSGAFKMIGVKNDATGAYDAMRLEFAGGTESANLDKLFGRTSLAVGQTVEGGASAYRTVTEKGQNAVFKLNGVEMERATNTFSIDGLTYTLQETTYTKKNEIPGVGGNPPTYEYEFGDPATIVTISRDTNKIVEGITEYLKLYNETIDYINDLYKADATYKDYPPLTAKQKEGMSENEIKLWEEKSKEGLLRNDANLDKILSSLRTSMYTKPMDSAIAIYDLGITTSFYSKDGNFSATSIDNLRAAIEKNPEAVRQLFAGEDGIMELVNKSINDAVTSSYSSPGYMVQVAGSNLLDTSSSIYRQIKEADDQLVTLEKRYWSEYNRYWKQFNNMEQLIQQMNSQSSWLSQQFS